MSLRLLLAAAAAAAVFFSTTQPIGGQSADRIAFFSDRDGDTEIYVMETDGTHERAITQNTAEDRDPVWSPDGQQIAFMSRRDGNPEIYLTAADGSNQRRLTNHPGGDFGPVWSPDGRRIAFVSERETQSDIYIVNADGSGLRRLTSDAADDYRPAWSPDGRRLLFLSQRAGGNTDGAGEMYVVAASGGEARPVTQKPRKVLWAAWSPDAGRIAFFMVGAQRLEVAVVAADGTGETNLSALARADADSQPVWSPDGRRIAFLGDREHTGAIGVYVMNADGSGARRVSPPAQPTSGPASWSGDSARVVYSGFEQGNWEVFVAGLEMQPRRLTTNVAMDMGATWAGRGGPRPIAPSRQ